MGPGTSGGAKEKMKELRDVLREVFMRTDSHFSYRDVLNISSACTGYGSLTEIRMFMEERFSKQILHIAEAAGSFENIEIDVRAMGLTGDSVCKWVSMIYGNLEYDQLLVPDCGSDIFRAIQLLKIIVETLQSHTQVVGSMSKVLLPLDRKCYFMDREIGLVEKIYHKMLFKILRKCRMGISKLLGLSLLASNIILSCASDIDGVDAFSESIRYFLHVLDGFGMKNRALLSTRDLIAEQDFHNLEVRKTDFETVFNYFKDQKYIYPMRLHKRIERLVLSRLYSDLGEAFVMDRLDKAEGLKFIVPLFARGGIKNKLLHVYKGFIGRIGSSFKEFHQNYTVNCKILEMLDDEDFRNASKAFFGGFFESKENCRQVSDFVDHLLRTGEDKGCDVVARITGESKDPEDFLKELQQKLSQRLISGLSDLERETRFLRLFKRMHNEKMLCMVNDCKSREPSLLLMTMCKWPIFRTEDVPLPDNHPIIRFRREKEAECKESRRRIFWIDSLSKVRFKLFGKILEASLFQYNVISNIIYLGTVVPRSQFHEYLKESAVDDVVSTVKVKKSSIRVPKFYAEQFDSLLENILLQTEEFFVLNPCLTGHIGIRYGLHKCVDEFEQDRSYSVKAFCEANICRIMKRAKEMVLEELQNAVGEIELDEMKKYLMDLEKKGFVVISGNKVAYCP